ncbi:MAG: hypothetical protein DI529_01140 [Chryseobacterium sp.]|nr:MAG: hypothetical protein DI529_01140 [Chryseobacterium sp.]
MKEKKIQINFPEAKWKYWFLIWIGKIHYESGERKIELYFYNKKDSTDYYDDIEFSNLQIKLLPVSFLSEFKIGYIYNVREKRIEITNGGYVFNIKIPKNLYLTKNKEFPLNGNPFFLKNAKDIIPLGFSYFKAFSNNRRENRQILISPYTILQFFLFNSDILIKKALCGELIEGFNFKNIKYRQCEENGDIVGLLEYDTQKIQKSDAVILAPYFFLKNLAGIKFLRSISTHVDKAFSDSLIGKKSTYLSFHWEDFINYELTIKGKPLYMEKDNEKTNYLLAYQIDSFRLKAPKPYTVDKIELFPMNSTTSTDDRKNHTPKNVDRPLHPETQGLSLTLNGDATNNQPAVDFAIENEYGNPFNIKVEVIKREKQFQAYNAKYYADKEITELTRELERFDNDSTIIRENIKNILVKISKLEYFNEVAQALKYKFTKNDSNFKVTLPYSFTDFYIVEISYLSKYMYLIEFKNGIIGVFNASKLNKLSTEKLNSIGNQFIFEKDEIEKGKVLWTYIKNVCEEKYRQQDIIIKQGVKHLNIPKGIKEDEIDNAIKEAAYKTAENIYTNRIMSTIF